MTIWDYIERVVQKRNATFLEIGACDGTETRKFLLALQSQGHYDFTFYCFEPDPRHADTLTLIAGENRFIKKAVGCSDGTVPFYQSFGEGNELYYGSSSIRLPKLVLTAWPDMQFRALTCESITLDTFCAQKGIQQIDFIWADVQGAERDLIAGGQWALAHTNYFYTEYCDGELYDGELTLAGIASRLPDFKLIENWNTGDALFQHKANAT